jgi:hypothetical protein
MERVFAQSELEAIAQALADTSEGLTGSDIAHLLATLKMLSVKGASSARRIEPCVSASARRDWPAPSAILGFVKARAAKPPISDPLVDVPPAVRPIVEVARQTVRRVAPQAEEVACWSQRPRSPSMMWKLVRYVVDGKVVVTIGTFTKHASMFFARGSEVEDPSGLLEGTGKKLRYITLRAPADAKRAAVKRALRNAFALAERSARKETS